MHHRVQRAYLDYNAERARVPPRMVESCRMPSRPLEEVCITVTSAPIISWDTANVMLKTIMPCLSFFPPPFEHIVRQQSFELQVYEATKRTAPRAQSPSLREDNVKALVLE